MPYDSDGTVNLVAAQLSDPSLVSALSLVMVGKDGGMRWGLHGLLVMIVYSSGCHTSTFQLNLSRFCTRNHPTCPTRSDKKWSC
jgi:hypothetical protein